MKEDIQKWNKVALDYTRMIKQGAFQQEFLYPLFLGFLGKLQGKRVLDFGCGPGLFAKMLSKKGAEVYAVDAASKMIELAQKEPGVLEDRIHFEVGDASKGLSFENNFFDLALAIHVLMDIENWQDSLKEIFRVLKPKGRFIFSVSHPCFTFPVMVFKRGVLGRIFPKCLSARVFDYFASANAEKKLRRKISISHYHRPINVYINTLFKTGFEIIRVDEPPMPSVLAQKSGFFMADRVPIVLVVQAAKRD